MLNIRCKQYSLILLTLSQVIALHSSENNQSGEPDSITTKQVLLNIGGLGVIGVTTYLAAPFVISGGALVATKTAAVYATTKVAAITVASKAAGAVTVAAPYVSSAAKCSLAAKLSWWGGSKAKEWVYPSREKKFSDLHGAITDEVITTEKTFENCLAKHSLASQAVNFPSACKDSARKYALLVGEGAFEKKLRMFSQAH